MSQKLHNKSIKNRLVINKSQFEIIHKEELDTLLGGFREYTPTLYEQEKPKEDEIKITEIFNNKQ